MSPKLTGKRMLLVVGAIAIGYVAWAAWRITRPATTRSPSPPPTDEIDISDRIEQQGTTNTDTGTQERSA